MYLIAIAWLYVSLMMAAAEAMHPQGTIIGAIFTFLLYGALPLSIVMYLMGTPMRRRARHLQEQAERAKAQELDADQAETRTTEGKPETSAHDLPHKES